jgi:pimeloyl-ACP methyl ester carboxylesterase
MCGLGPLAEDTTPRGLVAWLALTLLNPLIPTGVRFMFQSSPFGRVDLSDSERLTLLQKDIQSHTPSNEAARIERAEINRDPSGLERALRSSREAFSRGFRGTGQDGQLTASPYGFKIEEIRKDLPVQLWYGTLDAITPIEHGRMIKKALGKQAVLRESEDTHGSLQVRFSKEAWKALLDA